MDALHVSVSIVSLVGLFLIIWSFVRYQRTKDIAWWVVTIVGCVLLYVAWQGVTERRAIDARLSVKHTSP